MRRSKTTSSVKPSKSTAGISAPPKAAIATAKRINDMLHPRSSRERDRVRRVSDSASTRHERVTASLDEARPSEDEGSKDASQRIVDLEQALAVALQEQNTMREELTNKLREQEIVYRETVEEYRRQLAGTYQLQSPPGAFHSVPSPISTRSNSYENDSIPDPSEAPSRSHHEGQVENLRHQIMQLQDQLMTQEATHQSILEQKRVRDQAEWDAMAARLHATEKESQERLQQLLSLKSAFSSLTRADSQVTDSELSETFTQLSNRVREWVVNNFRRTKLDLNDVSPVTAKALEGVLLNGKEVAPTDRLALFQALVSSTMMQIFRETIFVGLPESGPLASLRNIAAIMQSAGSDYQVWRHATIRSLQNGDARFALEEAKRQLLHRLAAECISSITSAVVPTEAQSTLEAILNTAADFHMTLLLQKAQYQVQFFRHETDSVVNFDHNRMEPINEVDDYTDEEGDVIVDRTFTFCVFPCLEKFGDEHGKHSEVSNVLVKASVCCSIR